MPLSTRRRAWSRLVDVVAVHPPDLPQGGKADRKHAFRHPGRVGSRAEVVKEVSWFSAYETGGSLWLRVIEGTGWGFVRRVRGVDGRCGRKVLNSSAKASTHRSMSSRSSLWPPCCIEPPGTVVAFDVSVECGRGGSKKSMPRSWHSRSKSALNSKPPPGWLGRACRPGACRGSAWRCVRWRCGRLVRKSTWLRGRRQ